MAYFTVYDPAVLEEGVIAPVLVFIDKPVGVAEKVPPVVPEIVGVIGVD